MVERKITAGERRVLTLARRDAKTDGWAIVSEKIWPLVDNIPDRLLEKKPALAGGGYVRLTSDGEAILIFT